MVVIINHSTDLKLNIKVGDRIVRFLLTRFEAPNVIEVSELGSTARGSGGFSSTGHYFFLFSSVFSVNE